jgi:mono/diheme cytochrome c family protein
MFRRLPALLSAAGMFTAMLAIFLSAVVLQARAATMQQGPKVKKIWDGVYTADQAARGKKYFEARCGRCHNNELIGSSRGPALKDEMFLSNWENDSLASLFVKMRDTMPASSPSSLREEEYVDILAYVLQVNGFPAGTEELENNTDELVVVRIVPEGADASGVPDFALVQVVGCLTRSPSNAWMLTNTSEPLMTVDEVPADGLKRAKAQTLGTQTLHLVSIVSAFNPESHAGQRMEARGLLYRGPNENLLNLTSLKTVGSNCEN